MSRYYLLQITFLFVDPPVTMDHLYKRFQTRVGDFHLFIVGVLLIVQCTVAVLQPFFQICRYEERGPVSQEPIEFSQVDVDTRQVEIAEMLLSIGTASLRRYTGCRCTACKPPHQ